MTSRTLSPSARPLACVLQTAIRPMVLICFAVLLPGLNVRAQSLTEKLSAEGADRLAVAARERGDAVRGAILFTRRDLNCAQCHAPQAGQPVGPDLKSPDENVSDTYLVESLLDPSKVIRKGFESSTILTTDGQVLNGRILKQSADRLTIRLATADVREVTLNRSQIERLAPGTRSAMPDNLVDQLQSRDQFLDLARYVMELSDQRANPASADSSLGGRPVPAPLHGAALVRQYNCAACHRDDGIADNPLTAKRAPDLKWADGRIDPQYIRRFIADPLHVKPGTTMPDVMGQLSEEDQTKAADAITHFLASLSDRSYSATPLSAESAERGDEVFHSVGCVACHSPRDEQGQETLGQVSVPLGEIRSKYNGEALVEFLKDPLANRPSGRMPNLQLTHWEAIDVANFLLGGSEDGPASDSSVFQFDAAQVDEGKRWFTTLGCIQCHTVIPDAASANATALSAANLDSGCLSDDAGNWPKFGFAEGERDAIREALNAGQGPFSQEDQITVVLDGFRCLNCHQRNDLGGVSEARNPHFKTTDPNLGPQGRIPPPLTGIGSKLKPTWMRQVLVSGRAIRPYVMTRMPQYGADNVACLVDLFQSQDQTAPAPSASFEDVKEMRKVGGEMAGTAGLNCIACHTFQLKKAANMPAVDLTEMAERLHQDWFYRYMRNPQKFSPNTVMPSFWPAGRAMRKDILDGDTDLQIEALWQYLLDGRQARAPRGLIREPIELVATEEAVMLRRKFPEIGKRGIGVGYPGEINLAYDAEQMRLASIWKGKFADPGGVWRSQGHGSVRPLGRKVVQFPKGPDVDDARSPWVVDEGRPPNHQFKGYTLDDARRPRFHYELSGVDIHDYLVDEIDATDQQPVLRRTLTLQASEGERDLVFRAAGGKRIRALDDGRFQIDDSLTVRIPDDHTAAIVDVGDGQQLRIPLQATTSPVELVLHYHWQE